MKGPASLRGVMGPSAAEGPPGPGASCTMRSAVVSRAGEVGLRCAVRGGMGRGVEEALEEMGTAGPLEPAESSEVGGVGASGDCRPDGACWLRIMLFRPTRRCRSSSSSVGWSAGSAAWRRSGSSRDGTRWRALVELRLAVSPRVFAAFDCESTAVIIGSSFLLASSICSSPSHSDASSTSASKSATARQFGHRKFGQVWPFKIGRIHL